MTGEPKSVLLLEPCRWRFDGIARFLSEQGLRVFNEIAEVDVVLLARALVERELDHVRGAHPLIGILAYGDAIGFDEMAQVLALGVNGYFVLSSRQEQLLEAMSVVASRRIWAPREAVALMAQKMSPPPDREERAFLGLLLEGLSNKEIASRIGVAEVTVKARLTRLYKRHGVRTRLQLLGAAIRLHLIDLAP